MTRENGAVLKWRTKPGVDVSSSSDFSYPERLSESKHADWQALDPEGLKVSRYVTRHTSTASIEFADWHRIVGLGSFGLQERRQGTLSLTSVPTAQMQKVNAKANCRDMYIQIQDLTTGVRTSPCVDCCSVRSGQWHRTCWIHYGTEGEMGRPVADILWHEPQNYGSVAHLFNSNHPITLHILLQKHFDCISTQILEPFCSPSLLRFEAWYKTLFALRDVTSHCFVFDSTAAESLLWTGWLSLNMALLGKRYFSVAIVILAHQIFLSVGLEVFLGSDWSWSGEKVLF